MDCIALHCFQELLGQRVSVEHARGTRRDRSPRRYVICTTDIVTRSKPTLRNKYKYKYKYDIGSLLLFARRDRGAPWLDKYGPPTRTDYRVTIENLSTRVSWQVSTGSSYNTGRGVNGHILN